MPINFFNEDIPYLVRNKRALRKWIISTIEAEGFNLGIINIILSSDSYLLSINKKFLHHDYYTDIITFSYNINIVVSGDLYLSFDRIKDNARSNKVSVANELHRVIIHGVLHLCGYKDKTTEEKATMTAMENKYLSILDVPRGTSN